MSISPEEVQLHNKEDDLWVIYEGKVLDVSKFAFVHPGGFDIIFALAGRDITQAFDDVGHSDKAKQLLNKLAIGTTKVISSTTNTQTNEYPSTQRHVWDHKNFPFPITRESPMTMALKTTNEWLLVDQNYEFDLQQKYSFLNTIHNQVFCTSDLDTVPAGQEVLELFKKHLPNRYPEVFSSTHNSITIKPLGKTFQLDDPSLHPLDIAARLIQDDLAIMKKNPEGKWVLAAGSIVFPTAWNITEKIGKPMFVVHEPVPTLNSTIGNSIEKFFTNMKPSDSYKPAIVRFNWNLETSPTLRIPRPEGNEEEEFTNENVKNLYLRIERQTLRKLSKSGDILFTIGILHWPLNQVLSDPLKKEIFLANLKGKDHPEWRAHHRKYRPGNEVLINFLETTNFEMAKL